MNNVMKRVFVWSLTVVCICGLAHAAEMPELNAQLLIIRYEDAKTTAERTPILDALVNTGETAVPDIAKCIEESKSLTLRTDLAGVLGRIKSPQATPILIKLLQGRKGGLLKIEREVDKGLFDATISALVSIGDPAVPALIATIDGDSVYASVGALKSLAQIGTPQCQRAILDTAKNQKKLGTEKNIIIVQYLASLQIVESADRLCEYLSFVQKSVSNAAMAEVFGFGPSTNVELRSAVINALGVNRASPGIAVPALRKVLDAKGEDTIHRAMAARSIAKYDTPDVCPAMQSAFKMLPDLEKHIKYIMGQNADRAGAEAAKGWSTFASQTAAYLSASESEYKNQISIWIPLQSDLKVSVFLGLKKCGETGISFVESLQNEKKYKDLATSALKVLNPQQK